MSVNTTTTQQTQQSTQTIQTQQSQQAQQTQQSQVQTNAQMQAHTQADDPQMSPAEARELYRQQTKNMKDGVKFGRRPFKAKSAAEKEADKLRKEFSSSYTLLHKTQYTLETFDTVTEQKKQMTEMKQNPDIPVMMERLTQFHFTPKMFVSSEIRTHLGEYLHLVNTYDVLNAIRSQLTPEQQDQLKRLAPLMEQLKHRLDVYCEQNSIGRFSGSVTTKPRIFSSAKDQYSLTKDEIEKWYDTVQEYNQTRYTTTPTDAQRKAHRASIASN